MLSSVNAFGGLSAAELLTLFGANSSSSLSSNSTPTSTTQAASPGVDASGANGPANAIQAILAQAQMQQAQTATSGEGSTISITAQVAYSAQTDGSSSEMSASVTISSPDAVQQIGDAVSLINSLPIYTQTDVDPATHNGASAFIDPITVTANDAVNIAITNGAVSAIAMQGAAFPGGLPSLTSIQQAYGELESEDQSTGWGGTFDGNFTLVQLPSNTLGALGGNIATFGDNGNMWALVLPQDHVSVAVSDTQISS